MSEQEQQTPGEYEVLQKAYEKLKHENYFLETLIDNLPDSIYTKDLAGRKTLTNQVDLSIMGYREAGEVLGKTDLEIHANERGRQGYEDDLYVIRSGKSILNREDCYRDANGKLQWLLTSKVPMRNSAGEITGLLGIGRLITERKKMEEALRLSNERFLYATKATFDAIWDWDIENRYLYWGEGYEKIFGYASGDDSVNHIRSFDNIHPEDRERVFESIETVILGDNSNWFAEYRYQKANGEYAHVQDKGFLIRNREGKAVRMIGAMQDITEKKQSEELIKRKEAELCNKNKQLKRLSGHLQKVREDERKHLAREVHDELGQLASVVKMHIDWMRIRLPGKTEMVTQRIVHASSTAELMINSIRRIASDLRPLMLDDLGLIASLKWKCEEFTTENGLPCLFEGDIEETLLNERQKTELFRICQKALTNVIRHAKASNVTIVLKEVEDSILLKIRDNGIGFSVEERKNTLGLIGMEERAFSIGSLLHIESKKGIGTEIKVIVPKPNS